MGKSRVFNFDSSDPDMQHAVEEAQENFRYFWRELAWERRRIIPGLELAAFKAPFSDDASDPKAPVEQMWCNDVDFDGQLVHGVLLNEPNELTSVHGGDQVELPLNQISDWMYAIQGNVYGAFTVNVIRSRMSKGERAEHDAAWGLNFGDPKTIYVVPEQRKSGGFWSKLFGGGKKDTEIGEHPMSENMADSFQQQLTAAPSLLKDKDERGWTLLHHQALAGSLATVKVLLACGADPNAKTDHGMTPRQLAQSLGWDKVAALLKTKK